MTSYKITTFIPNDDDVSFFNMIKGSNFPWYYQSAIGSRSFLGHTVMIRDPSSQPIEGIVNSDYFEKCKEILLRHCKDNDIPCDVILRVNFNLSFSDQKYNDTIHVDHFFPHKVFLLYLTSSCVGGQTLLYTNGKDQAPIEIPSEENKVIVFDGSIPHDIISCGLGERRIVLIITFV